MYYKYEVSKINVYLKCLERHSSAPAISDYFSQGRPSIIFDIQPSIHSYEIEAPHCKEDMLGDFYWTHEVPMSTCSSSSQASGSPSAVFVLRAHSKVLNASFIEG